MRLMLKNFIKTVSFCLSLILFENLALAANKFSDYFDAYQSFVADFVQIDSSGAKQYGNLSVLRPGKMRWEYQKPKKILMILNGEKITHHDFSLEQTSYFNTKNEYFILLSGKDLGSKKAGVNIKEVERKSGEVGFEVSKEGVLGKLLIVFEQKSRKLVSIYVEEENIGKLVIKLHNIEKKTLSDELFYFRNPG